MGKHANFVKGTADTLRRITTTADENYTKAEEALTATEHRDARLDARESHDLGAKFPALGNR